MTETSLEDMAIVPPPSSDEPLPDSVSIPDPVLVRDLAAALHMKAYAVIRELMRQEVFVTPETPIDFTQASVLCSHLGVVAHKII